VLVLARFVRQICQSAGFEGRLSGGKGLNSLKGPTKPKNQPLRTSAVRERPPRSLAADRPHAPASFGAWRQEGRMCVFPFYGSLTQIVGTRERPGTFPRRSVGMIHDSRLSGDQNLSLRSPVCTHQKTTAPCEHARRACWRLIASTLHERRPQHGNNLPAIVVTIRTTVRRDAGPAGPAPFSSSSPD